MREAATTSTPVSTRPVFTDEQREMYRKLKTTYKELSLAIRYLKADRKLVNNTTPKVWVKALTEGTTPCLAELQSLARAIHIARSLAKGKTMEQIEPPSLNEGKRADHKEDWRMLGMEQKVAFWTKALTDPGSIKLYVCVRESLSKSQQAVQAAHAVANFQKAFPTAPWTNGTLVLLSLKDVSPSGRDTFEAEANALARLTTPFITTFQEPDLDNKTTAFAALIFRDNFCPNGAKLL